jgi:hypothetical protein
MAWRPPHSSGNPNRRRHASKEPKPVITWKDPDAGYGLGRREKPLRYRSPGVFTSSFKEKLTIGALMAARLPMSKIDKERPNYPFPTLREAYRRELIVVPVGACMIYAGTVRVVERVRSNRQLVDMEVPKHTFIIPNIGRCIIHDLRLVMHT